MRTCTTPPVQAAPNVTPMIDVMLVLLICFLVVTPLLHEQLATPPAARFGEARPEQPTDHVLEVDRYGTYYLAKHPIPHNQLLPQLQSLFVVDVSHPLYVRADEHLDYGVVAGAIDVVRRAGAHTVGIISRVPRGTRFTSR